jgi:hypothetical protein
LLSKCSICINFLNSIVDLIEFDPFQLILKEVTVLLDDSNREEHIEYNYSKAIHEHETLLQTHLLIGKYHNAAVHGKYFREIANKGEHIEYLELLNVLELKLEAFEVK